jgi:hypothetical protein
VEGVESRIATARGLCETGIPVAAIEELEHAVDEAASLADADSVRRIAAELQRVASLFPDFAGRAEAAAEAARVRARDLDRPEPVPTPEPAPIKQPEPGHSQDERTVVRGTPKPLRARATWAQLTLFAVIVAGGLAVLSDAAERSLLRDLETGVAGLAEANANDQRQLLVGVIVLACYVVAAIPFIAWLHRAYSNLRPLGAGELRYGTGWAIGAWFVPILGLFRPKQIANDVWRASDPELPPSAAGLWAGRSVPTVLWFWWAFFIAGWVLAQVASRLSLSGETLEQLRAANGVAMLSDLITIAGAALAIVVVRRVTARQEARAARLRAAA